MALHHVRAIIGAISLAFLALTPASQVNGQTPAPPPAEAFSRLPFVSSVAISADGKKLAMLQFENGAAAVAVFSVDTNAQIAALKLGAVKGRGLEWAGNNHVLVTASETRRAPDNASTLIEFTRVLSFDIRDAKVRWLAANNSNYAQWVWGRLPGDETGVLMPALTFDTSSYKPSTGSKLGSDTPEMDALRLVLFRVDAASGDVRSFATGERFTTDWVVSPKGEALARADLDPNRRTYTLYAKGGTSWRRVLEIPNQVSPPLDLVAAAPTPNSIYVFDRQAERLTLKTLDLATGAMATATFPGIIGDVMSAEIDPLTREIVQVTTTNGVQWIAPQLKEAQDRMTRALPKARVEVTGWSADRTRIVVSAESPSSPTTFYLYDTVRRAADTIGEDYPELAGVPLGEKVAVDYAARDATRIPAYLTWPPGRDRKNLPLVVLPHGGPEAADEPGFDWLAQFLATRGYLVLQPQFRGSTGRGKAWADAGRGQWGGVMQNDVSDGVAYLTKAGMADAKRVCIVGASYGGYSALAGATMTPELYACAASINGVADLPMMIRQVRAFGNDQGNALSLNYWIDHIGSEGDPAVRASPFNRAAAARAPVLLIHGRKDSVVPFAQSANMAEALRSAGKNVRLVELTDEDHWLSTANARQQTLVALEPFLAQALTPR